MNEFENTGTDPDPSVEQVVEEQNGTPYDGGDIPPAEAPVEDQQAPLSSPPVEAQPEVPVETDQSETT